MVMRSLQDTVVQKHRLHASVSAATVTLGSGLRADLTLQVSPLSNVSEDAVRCTSTNSGVKEQRVGKRTASCYGETQLSRKEAKPTPTPLLPPLCPVGRRTAAAFPRELCQVVLEP